MEQSAEGRSGRAGAGHGLIIGKFLPFHLGHRALIERALARCESVTIVVFSRDAEPIAGHVRAGWVRQECPAAHVIHLVDNYPDPWDEESWRHWVDACRRCAPRSTHLFTGEDYGDELARRLEIEHVRVDRGLEAPICGTDVRQNPIANWRFVPNAVRPYLVRRVAVVGAESTGKTTLAKSLAHLYGTVWVPEYGRAYCEMKDIDSLTPTDLLSIAVEQAEAEDRLAAESNGLLICDTDLMVTRAWCAHLCGMVHPGIAEIERSRRYDLHLITNPKVLWRNDGTRVCQGDGVREWFHGRYVEELTDRGAPHMLLPVRQADALHVACDVIETLWPPLRSVR